MRSSIRRAALIVALHSGLVLSVQAQLSAQAALATLTARLGPEITPDEQAYFGLFYPFRDRFQHATARLDGDALLLDVYMARNGVPADTTYRLDAADAAILAGYVDSYERIFLEGVGAHAAELSTLIRRRLARPASLPEGALRRVQVTTQDGQLREGGLLYASETYWALWPGRAPYTWQQSNRVTWIPAAQIVAVHVPGLSTGLRLGEAALQVGAQIAAAAPGALGLDRGVQGPLLTGLSTAAVLTALRLRPSGGTSRMAANLPAGMPPLFERAAPPEFLALLRAQPAFSPASSGARRSRRSYVDVTLGTSYALGSSGGAYDTRSTASGSDFSAGPRTYAEADRMTLRPSSLHLDVQVNPMPFLYVGVEGRRFRDTYTPEYGESITGLRTGGVYGGIQLAGTSPVLSGHSLALGGGYEVIDARLQGSFYTTLALQQGKPQPAQMDEIVYTYEAPARVKRPFVRLAYEYALTDLTSFFAKADLATTATVSQPRRTFESSYLGNTFTTERPAHDLRLIGQTIVVGTRLHF